MGVRRPTAAISGPASSPVRCSRTRAAWPPVRARGRAPERGPGGTYPDPGGGIRPCALPIERRRHAAPSLRPVSPPARKPVQRGSGGWPSSGSATPRGEPGKNGAPGGIRTPDPQIRSLVLYPAELRARRARRRPWLASAAPLGTGTYSKRGPLTRPAGGSPPGARRPRPGPGAGSGPTGSGPRPNRLGTGGRKAPCRL